MTVIPERYNVWDMTFRERAFAVIVGEVRRCECCGRLRHWVHVAAWFNDAGEIEGYVCDGGCDAE